MKKSKKISIVLLIAFLLSVGGFSFYLGNSESVQAQAAPVVSSSPTASGLYGQVKSDIIIGDENAPVTIVEYSSMSCPHCAKFHQKTLPQLKEHYINSGKVKYINRHFPLNEPALKAGMLTLCVPPEKHYQFVGVLFDMQNKWAFGADYMESLRRIALVGGVSSESFEQCMKNTKIEKQLLTNMQEGSEKLGITSTPTFFVNGQLIKGAANLATFTAAIESHLK